MSPLLLSSPARHSAVPSWTSFWFAAVLGLVLPKHAASADDYRVYVSNERAGDIAVIAGPAGRVVDRLVAGKRPRGLHLSEDGRTLYVATSGSPRLGPGADPERARSAVADKSADGIAVIDVVTSRMERHLKVGSDPEEFALSRDGRRVIVANEDIGEASVWEIASGRELARAKVSGEPEGVTLHPERDEVYVACEEEGDIFVLSEPDGHVVARLAIGGRPRTIVFTPDGRRAFVPLETLSAVAVIDASIHRLEKIVRLPPPALPMGSAISADGREVFVSTGRGNTVVVLDARELAVLATIPVGERPWGIALSPDGRTLYSANGGSNDVSVIDVAERRERGRIQVGDGPWGVAVGPVVQ